MSGRKEDKERLTESNKPSKRYETTKMGVVLFVTCVAAIIVSIIGVAIIGGALGWIRNLIGIIACVAGAIGSWGCFPLTLLFVCCIGMIVCVSLSVIAIAIWFIQLVAEESPSYADIIVTFILFGIFSAVFFIAFLKRGKSLRWKPRA
eukprot:TRINITY_DN7522_c0_g1_i1.p1 TRINITY_DN7522_c0_g1~~TRINITY_DN7522_c0_g1_i1.p1  ORF type:complete len:148 (-),score=14.71 TRINITY_DN7522_c0_g1_i1:114-557(-)